MLSLRMQIIDGSTVMTHVLRSWLDAELPEHLDSQTLEADELHHIELGWLGLQQLQRSHTQTVLRAKQGSMIKKMLQDGDAVVFLKIHSLH